MYKYTYLLSDSYRQSAPCPPQHKQAISREHAPAYAHSFSNIKTRDQNHKSNKLEDLKSQYKQLIQNQTLSDFKSIEKVSLNGGKQ